jgi:hypothetical protein
MRRSSTASSSTRVDEGLCDDGDVEAEGASTT